MPALNRRISHAPSAHLSVDTRFSIEAILDPETRVASYPSLYLRPRRDQTRPDPRSQTRARPPHIQHGGPSAGPDAGRPERPPGCCKLDTYPTPHPPPLMSSPPRRRDSCRRVASPGRVCQMLTFDSLSPAAGPRRGESSRRCKQESRTRRRLQGCTDSHLTAPVQGRRYTGRGQ